MDLLYDISVFSLEETNALLATPAAKGYAHAISIGSPVQKPPDNLYEHNRNVLRLEFDDVEFEDKHFHMFKGPAREDVQAILDFGQSLAGKKEKVLIHCQAGISRSGAAGFLLLYLKEQSALKAREVLFKIRPKAIPNQSMIQLADEILATNLLPVARDIQEEGIKRMKEHLKDMMKDFPMI